MCLLWRSICEPAFFLQGLDGPEMVYTGKFRHALTGDHFHFADLAAHLWLLIKLQVAFNRIVYVFHGFRNGCALRMAAREFLTAYGHAFVVLQQRDMEFLRHQAEYKA